MRVPAPNPRRVVIVFLDDQSGAPFDIQLHIPMLLAACRDAIGVDSAAAGGFGGLSREVC
jgi:hypothetical protein